MMGLGPGKIIIGIHGIGNKPPKNLLKKWWIKSINDGMKLSGFSARLPEFDIVYWSDVIYEMPQDPNTRDKKDPLYIKRPYAPCSNSLEKWKPSELKKKILDNVEKGLDKIFLQYNSFINLDSISDLIMKKLFQDMDAYYHSSVIISADKELKVKDVIREKLIKVIRKHKKKKIMLIAHSMGSIIAYDVLTRELQDVNIDTLITMGSPLALPLIKKKIFEESGTEQSSELKIPTPENIIKRWYNLSDLDDRIAVNYDLSDDLSANSKGIRPEDIIVKNMYEYRGKKNAHKSYGYLRTPEMSEKIYDFIKEGSPGVICKLKNIFRKKGDSF